MINSDKIDWRWVKVKITDRRLFAKLRILAIMEYLDASPDWTACGHYSCKEYYYESQHNDILKVPWSEDFDDYEARIADCINTIDAYLNNKWGNSSQIRIIEEIWEIQNKQESR
jgi:hypothetical protein